MRNVVGLLTIVLISMLPYVWGYSFNDWQWWMIVVTLYLVRGDNEGNI